MLNLTIIKYNIVMQMRKGIFVIFIGIGMMLAFLCVPDSSAGYEIFYLGGVHRIYNSEYLGAMASMLSMIALWLPGFYMLRSQITDDKRFKVGQIIASRPISKSNYIICKWVSNIVILSALELGFILSFIGMQFIRGESYKLNLWGFANPFLQVTFPYILLIASFAIIFDVIPMLKGAFGNVMYFILWIFLFSFSVETPNNMMIDIFGFNQLMSSMMKEATTHFPNIENSYYGMGFNSIGKVESSFAWSGLSFNMNFLLTRLFWFGISVLLILFSVMLFNRFREKIKHPKRNSLQSEEKSEISQHRQTQSTFRFSGINKSGSQNIGRVIIGEIKNIISGYPIWWYGLLLLGIVLALLLPLDEYYFLYSMVLFLLIPIWSKLGNQDSILETLAFVCCRRSAKTRWLSSLISGIIVSMVLSSGFIIRLIVTKSYLEAIAFAIGIVFSTNLGLTLGSISQNRVPFEAIFVILFYIGPLHNLTGFDFFGLQSINILPFSIASTLLMLIGFSVALLKDKHIIKYA